MVEKLLQFFVAKVDAHLLEAVEVEDLEAGDVQDSDEGDPDKQKTRFKLLNKLEKRQQICSGKRKITPM